MRTGRKRYWRSCPGAVMIRSRFGARGNADDRRLGFPFPCPSGEPDRPQAGLAFSRLRAVTMRPPHCSRTTGPITASRQRNGADHASSKAISAEHSSFQDDGIGEKRTSLMNLHHTPPADPVEDSERPLGRLEHHLPALPRKDMDLHPAVAPPHSRPPRPAFDTHPRPPAGGRRRYDGDADRRGETARGHLVAERALGNVSFMFWTTGAHRDDRGL